MANPDWDRWHDLLDIRDGPGFTELEALEYAEFLPTVAKLDAEAAAISNAAIGELVVEHERRLAGLERLIEALRAAR